MRKNERRNFLKKLALASSGLFVSSKTITKTSETKKIVKNIKPLGFQWETQDPFLFCVHHEDFFPKGNDNLGPDSAQLQGRQMGSDFVIKDGWRMYHGKEVPGFPGHPHRGFETVTVVRKGLVDHSDSLGASGRYGDGDVQWMTAGKGVQHAEMFPLINKNDDNPMELFQIWLNLPKKDKMVEANYKMLWSEDIPLYSHKDINGKITKIEVVAGKIENSIAPSPTPNSWANNKSNEVAIWNIEMEPNAIWSLPKASEGINRTIYFYKGDSLKVNSENLKHYHSADVDASGTIVLESDSSGAKILILQGKPIGEPVVQHGPFVMNTRDEIRQTFDDYQKTQFGGWPWPSSGPTHGSERKRFAKYVDGTEENKS